ncbi:MAG: flagellar biosynthetic protein FliO [Pseudomonadales bacterium]|nr:flagellar biosynthetic protein FliO [Gammaproteobacteria bacterium]
MGTVDWASFAASFFLVLILLAGTLFALKRMQGLNLSKQRNGQLQIKDSLSLGTRQKLVLVEVGTRQVLVGLSPTQMTRLGEWRAESADFQAVMQQMREESSP